MFSAKDHLELFLYSLFGAEKDVFCATVLLGRFPCFLICTWQCELQLFRRSLTDIFAATAAHPSIFACLGDGHGRQIMAHD